MGRPKNNELREKVRRTFLETGSTRMTAKSLGLHLNTIRYHLKNLGIDTPRVGRIVPTSAVQRNKELILKMCDDGCSLREIGMKIGTNPRHVKAFLVKNGVTKEFVTWKTGEDHYAWKGRLIDKDGYVLIHCKGHPNRRKHTNYVFEHRLVMEKMIGRYLKPTEVVHHKDGNKQNNSPENLQLFSENSEHLAFELKGRIPKWTPEGIESMRKHRLQRRQTQQ